MKLTLKRLNVKLGRPVYAKAKAVFFANSTFEVLCYSRSKSMNSAIWEVFQRLRTWRKYQDYADPDKLDEDILDILKDVYIEEGDYDDGEM